MNSQKPLELNSINTNNSSINLFKSNEIQDLLYFKNDILKDIRMLDDKLNLKMIEQREISTQHYNDFDSKLEKLTTQINKISSTIIDNSNFAEAINSLQKFSHKAEDNFNRLNSRIVSMNKELTKYFDKVESMFNENLNYPGIIGNKARFSNFRNFIDYILKSFREFNDFKQEIRDFEFNKFKKKMIEDIQDVRYAIIESNRNSLQVATNNISVFDKKLEKYIKENNKIMEENEDKFHNFKNEINNCIEEYQTKFTSIEKKINDKFTEQLNEMEIFEKMKNKLIEDINEIKSNVEEIKKNYELKEENEQNYIEKINNNNRYFKDNINSLKEDSKNDDNQTNLKKILFEKLNESQLRLNSRNINYKTIAIRKRRNEMFLKELLLNNNNNKLNSFLMKNINFKDKFHNSEENNSEHSTEKIKNITQILEKSNSYEKSEIIKKILDYFLNEENNNLNNINIKENLSLSHEDTMSNEERFKQLKSDNKKQPGKNDLNRYLNISKKDFFKNNYSISNIPNIKINKVVLPKYINNKNKNNEIGKPSNNLSSTTYKKFSFHKDNFNFDNINKTMRRRNSFVISKINKDKEEKTKNIKFAETARNFQEKANDKNNIRLNSLMIIKAKDKNKSVNNSLNNSGNFTKGKKKNLSFENDNNEKYEKIQIGFKKNINTKNKINELILINTKRKLLISM